MTQNITVGNVTLTVPDGAKQLSVVSHPTLGVQDAQFAAPNVASAPAITASAPAVHVQVKVSHGQKTGQAR